MGVITPMLGYYATLAFAFREDSIKEIDIDVMIPTEYAALMEAQERRLEVELSTIKEQVQQQLNEALRKANSNSSIVYNLQYLPDETGGASMGITACGGQSVEEYTNILNSIESEGDKSIIYLFPCMPDALVTAFDRVHSGVPVITTENNLVCGKRSGIFETKNFTQMLSVFSNALIRSSFGPSKVDVSITENQEGDQGLKLSITIPDSTIQTMMEDACFYNK